MKKFIVLLCVCLFSVCCGSDDNSSSPSSSSKYAGSYSGSLFGSMTGTSWAGTITTTGSFSGAIGSDSFSGSVNSSGLFTVTSAGGMTMTATINDSFQIVSATWSKASDTGTFNGGRL